MPDQGITGWDRFNQVSDTYDDHFITTREPARRLVAHANIEAGARVLEVGSGTGIATLLLAEAVGPEGSVVATDIAASMLDVARAKMASAGIDNVEFQAADGTALPFPDTSFDVAFANCVLLGFPDVGKALREWIRVLRPGGTAAFTSFSHETEFPFQRPEAVAVLDAHLGQRPRANPRFAIDTTEKCRAFMQEAEFQGVLIEEVDLGYRYPDFEACWQEWWASLFRLRLANLDADETQRLKEDLGAALAPAFSDGGLYRANITILVRGRT